MSDQSEWTYEAYTPYYSWATQARDGSNEYQLMVSCETCACEVCRVNPDADTDGEGGMRDCTTYYCADCGAKVDRVEVDDNAKIDELKLAIAASMFRGFSPFKATIADAYLGLMRSLAGQMR